MNNPRSMPAPGEPGRLEFLRVHAENRFVFARGKPRRALGEPLRELLRLEREAAYNEALNAIEKPTKAMKERIERAREKGPEPLTWK